MRAFVVNELNEQKSFHDNLPPTTLKNDSASFQDKDLCVKPDTCSLNAKKAVGLCG